MGLSNKEQKERAKINRASNHYLYKYLEDNYLLDPELSNKQNVFKYFCKNIIGYKHGKNKQRALAKYIQENNKLPYSINELKGYHGYKPTKTDDKPIKVKGEFYKSREWRELRVKALINNGRKCCLCGRNPKEHGIILHVDHIKPRSKYPELELKLRNLQILCEDCNLGKSNKYEDDWR
jgi:5-methylcytosine-specific restriction endonuclease McrA